jgi:putative bacteriophage tail fiber protein
LISLMVEAGAKRVDVVEPNFSTVADTQAPKIGTCTVTYGGIEDD